jgi:hypothetical protein
VWLNRKVAEGETLPSLAVPILVIIWSGNNLAALGWIKDLRVGDLLDPILLLVNRH